VTTPIEIVDPVMSVSRGVDGVVRVRWEPGTAITEDAARRSIELVQNVSGGHKRLLLVDMSEVKSMTRESRNVYAGNDSMLALALVGQSPVVRVIANFALNLHPPSVPTKFCTSVAEAETWLDGFPR
jgi:hypothetical protein